ncbi:MAG: ABC transporter ATP-binding protein [Actinomycetia bacterium]|nr:ABC transporter ATP-binding protein [Actinomycetes bacterium]
MSDVPEAVPLLAVDGLSVTFGRAGASPAVRDIAFTLSSGERWGLIGESGSGKSATALAIMGLLPEGVHVHGSVRWRGGELVGLGDAAYSRLRGDAMTMVFQEPMTALDPTMTVGRQVAEVLRLHYVRRAADAQRYGVGPERIRGHARERVLGVLAEVGLPDVERIADSFPHQLSGGQRQLVLIGMALMNSPLLVICDEPTTALDVTVQATVLRLLDAGLSAVGAACLFISHDLAVVSQVCSQVMVMYQGRIVERGSLAQVLGAPAHPYTRGLVATAAIDAVPPGERLPVIGDFWAGEDGGRDG